MEADRERSLAHRLADLTGPRVDRPRPRELPDIIAIAIRAVVAGADSRDDIEDLGRAKHDRPETSPGPPDGIPRHDAYRRPSGRPDPDEFRRGLLGQVGALHEAAGRQVIAIDGEALRRSSGRAEGESAPHVAHARATANRPPPGRVAVGEKPDEITVIPELLRICGGSLGRS